MAKQPEYASKKDLNALKKLFDKKLSDCMKECKSLLKNQTKKNKPTKTAKKSVPKTKTDL